MKFKEFLDKAFFYLSVPKCVCCKERLSINERALCTACMEKYRESMTLECPVCLKKTPLCACCNKDMSAHFIKSHIKLYKYASGESARAADSMIYAIKRGGSEALFDFLADELAMVVRSHILKLDNAVITNIPRRKSAVLRFGIDHARVLSEFLAKKLNVEYIDLLKSTAKTAQKSLSREQRIANTEFTLVKEPDLKGRCVIILDDVVTTGASMSGAALLIRSLGAKDIHAVSIGYAYRHILKE